MTIAVIGLGGMGSAALYHLARRGERVVGFEQFGPANARGASHGRSRIIRQAYFEDARYVPLLKRAYELWQELDARAIEPVWTLCGGVAIGSLDSALIAGNLASAKQYGIDHELLDRRDAMKRFPAFALEPDEVAVFEPTVGALFPERCVAENLRAAIDSGAQAHFGVRVGAIEPESSHVRLRLSDGSSADVDRIVLTAGPWINDFIDMPVRVERNVQHWFAPPAVEEPQHIYMLHRPQWPRLLYGFPDFGEGIKAAFHHSGDFLEHPTAHDDRTHADEIDAVRAALNDVFTSPVGEHRRSEPCMYAVTPDEHFVIGASAADERVVIGAGFSGHGFKFCSVVGEVLADLATAGKTAHDISLFDVGRLVRGAHPSSAKRATGGSL